MARRAISGIGGTYSFGLVVVTATLVREEVFDCNTELITEVERNDNRVSETAGDADGVDCTRRFVTEVESGGGTIDVLIIDLVSVGCMMELVTDVGENDD